MDLGRVGGGGGGDVGFRGLGLCKCRVSNSILLYMCIHRHIRLVCLYLGRYNVGLRYT